MQVESAYNRRNHTMRNLLAFALSLGIATTSVIAQEDPTAIVKKAIEAHGGADALNKAKTAKSLTKGTMTVAGSKIEYTATAQYSLPDKYKLEVSGEISKLKLITTQILNGKKVKVRASLQGADQPMDPKVKDETIQVGLIQEVSLLTPLLDAKKYTLKSEKEADVNGSPASVVLVTGNGLKDLRFFFDKKTNLLVKMQRKALGPTSNGLADVEEETILSDFKKYDSALLPSKMIVNHDKKEYMTMVVTEWKFLEKIDPAEFAIDD
jgi:hypothetical protein